MKLLAALGRCGLLMQADAALPSAVTLLAGGPVKGTWWSHPKGNEIYNAINALLDLPDVAAAPLVNGKVTFVHRPLWKALAAVGGEGAAWQTAGLTAPEKKLLAAVRAAGEMQASGPTAKKLEMRLLVAAEQIHTESGKHAKVLWTWDVWAKRRKVRGALPDPAQARRTLEDAAKALAGDSGVKLRLPWPQGH